MTSFLGKNLKKIRKKWRYSQDGFGEIFGLNTGVISTYERDAHEPKTAFFIKLFQLTGIPIQNLLTREVSDDEIPKRPSAFTELEPFSVNDPPAMYQKEDDEIERHKLMNFYKLVKEVEDLRWELTKIQVELEKLKRKE